MMELNQNLLSSELQVDSIATSHLKETARWAKFLAVLGIVLSILIAILAFFAGTILSDMSKSFQNNASAGAIGSGLITVIYLFVAVIYFFLSLFLLRFATKMKLALTTNDQETFNGSLMNLKLVYRILGIIMIIYLGIVALAIVGGIIVAAFMK